MLSNFPINSSLFGVPSADNSKSSISFNLSSILYSKLENLTNKSGSFGFIYIVSFAPLSNSIGNATLPVLNFIAISKYLLKLNIPPYLIGQGGMCVCVIYAALSGVKVIASPSTFGIVPVVVLFA